MSALPSPVSKDRIIDAVLIVACGIGQALAALCAALATRSVFASLHAGAPLSRGTVITLGAAGLSSAVFYTIAQRRSEALGQSYANTLRQALYKQIAQLPKSRHEQRRLGALSLRFVGDLSAARLWFGTGLPDVMTACIVLPAALIILNVLDPALAGAVVAPLAVAAGLAVLSAWRLARRHRLLRSRRANLAINMIERIAISPELDQMGRTPKELRSLAERGQFLRTHAVARRSRTATLHALLQAGTAIAGLALLLRGSHIGASTGTIAASLAVLALIALPLRNLASAWDRYCAWHIAREKALKLFQETTIHRSPCTDHTPAQLRLSSPELDLTVAPGETCKLVGENAPRIARQIAHLDPNHMVSICMDGAAQGTPKIAFIDDRHIGLQGSLRRSATMLCDKRPPDSLIRVTLAAYGLSHLISHPKGLDHQIAEAGRDLSVADSLRLDLARAELGRATVLVVASIRFNAVPKRDELTELFQNRTAATVIIAQAEDVMPTLI